MDFVMEEPLDWIHFSCDLFLSNTICTILCMKVISFSKTLFRCMCGDNWLPWVSRSRSADHRDVQTTAMFAMASEHRIARSLV
jgi:hypothetical protein